MTGPATPSPDTRPNHGAGEVCGHYDDATGRHCGGTPVRRYLLGWRCAACAPNAVTRQGAPPTGTPVIPLRLREANVTVPQPHQLNGRCQGCGWPHERYGPQGTPHCLTCAACR
ncbi:hypothetical protein [Nonomuraea basaltis]|uniref:hypothetical protein n=1 Tax=Nonomuraea basaltis TaxID=2495887 RepID=UPI00110C44E4|nr:hypothetical protein [Nonomuraea basaltis]TMR97570.1 hypothetical protein EJK15_17790 [Nonomuraea basaltis]